jgi:carboxyl-terminal processing protease
VWVDEVSVTEIDTEHHNPLSVNAERYLTAAFDIVRAQALDTSKVNWNSITKIAHALVSGAQTTADTYPAIDFLIARLNDGHSHFIGEQQNATFSAQQRSATVDVESRLIGKVGYLKLGGFSGYDRDRIFRYASEARASIARSRAAASCGWIVDLRSNGGGNIVPMLVAVQPFVGSNSVARLVHGELFQDVQANSELLAETEKSGDLKLDLMDAPVAVLTGPRTASSGELVAITFIGRAQTRLFGSPTAGKSTGVRPNRLEDGATLNIASSIMADRNGRLYGGRVLPDELVVEATATEEKLFQSASAWLASKSRCDVGAIVESSTKQ